MAVTTGPLETTEGLKPGDVVQYSLHLRSRLPRGMSLDWGGIIYEGRRGERALFEECA